MLAQTSFGVGVKVFEVQNCSKQNLSLRLLSAEGVNNHFRNKELRANHAGDVVNRAETVLKSQVPAHRPTPQGCTGSGPPAPVVIWGGRHQPQLRPPPPPARSGPRSANTSLAAHEALPASGRWGLHSAPVTEPAPLRQPAPLQEFSAQSATGYAPRASDPFRFMKD
ncbi:hypothetical protein NDU88_003163 [Pleurodeles waltl]|uniref:Uncharacterized protein n=1 Tax=Pleurodeles waltl TaxID=8319 RepID=A0AAV7VEL3_PLEWA|nr:hypothetical protein NDU88_003163 [Pleurodeles waltl]